MPTSARPPDYYNPPEELWCHREAAQCAYITAQRWGPLRQRNRGPAGRGEPAEPRGACILRLVGAGQRRNEGRTFQTRSALANV